MTARLGGSTLKAFPQDFMADSKSKHYHYDPEAWMKAPWHSWGSPVGLSIFFVVGLCVPLLAVGVFLMLLKDIGLIG